MLLPNNGKLTTLPIILASKQKRYVVSFTKFLGFWLKTLFRRAKRGLQVACWKVSGWKVSGWKVKFFSLLFFQHLTLLPHS
jgi:hypothetical protein